MLESFSIALADRKSMIHSMHHIYTDTDTDIRQCIQMVHELGGSPTHNGTTVDNIMPFSRERREERECLERGERVPRERREERERVCLERGERMWMGFGWL
jgi:hypothetical protein